MARRSSMAAYPSAARESGRCMSKTRPGLISRRWMAPSLVPGGSTSGLGGRVLPALRRPSPPDPRRSYHRRPRVHILQHYRHLHGQLQPQRQRHLAHQRRHPPQRSRLTAFGIDVRPLVGSEAIPRSVIGRGVAASSTRCQGCCTSRVMTVS